jgi:hypothetical protein
MILYYLSVACTVVVVLEIVLICAVLYHIKDRRYTIKITPEEE